MKHLQTASGNRFCLVSIQIGPVHAQYWNLLFKKSWLLYARRHSYDILIIEEAIDGAPPAPEETLEPARAKIQKLKIPGLRILQGYERVVYLDADIFLTETAPCIASATDLPAE
jgi:hypothetical protein